MNRLLTLLSLVLLFSVFSPKEANAQSQIQVPEGFELGIRLGQTQGDAFVFDAVLPFRGNRLRTDIGLFDGFSITGLHDWKFIMNENFFWYPGIGAVLDFDNGFDLDVAAEIGIEYIFSDMPLTLSVDWRPTLGFDNGNINSNSFGINLRYTFDQSR